MQTVPQNAHVSDSPAPPYLPPKLKSPDSGDPEVYVKFPEGVPSFSRFLDASRPTYAASNNCSAGRGARMWTSRRVGGNLTGPEFANLALLRPSISMYSPALRPIAHRRRPLLSPLPRWRICIKCGIFPVNNVWRRCVSALSMRIETKPLPDLGVMDEDVGPLLSGPPQI